MTPIMAMLTVALCSVAAAQTGQAAYPPGNAPIQLRERVAQSAVNLEKPESLYALVGAIEQCFGVRISVEPLPEHFAGAEVTEAPPGPFAIVEGEVFSDVIARLEAASQGRWIFEELHGVPLLRPNPLVESQGTLLDTVVTVNIRAASVWEAICALARALNSANGVQSGRARPLLIVFPGPAVLQHPPAVLIEERPVDVTLSQVTAREALCSIFKQLDLKLYYLYNCVAAGRPALPDYVSINVLGEDGQTIRGARMLGEECKELMETVDWMSEEDVLAVQAPLVGGGEE
jgi:hypothetical protein